MNKIALSAMLVGSLLVASSRARAEGSEEVGRGQRLVDDTVLDVDIVRAGEVIMLRAGSDVASAVDVEITSPSGLVERSSLTSGRGWTDSLSANLCEGFPFVTREVGTHHVRFVLRVAGLDAWLRTLTPFDVAVTPSACTEAPITGRLHATRWHLRATDWSRDSAVTTSFYAVAHRDIVALDLAGVAGYEYFIQAGPRGLEAPYERTSQPARITPSPITRPVYPLYLHPPALDVARGDLGRLDGVRRTAGEAALALAFAESCTWDITIDRDHDGVFDVVRDAPVLRGTAEPGALELRVDTRGVVGSTPARIRLQTDEVHFAGYDVETARPGISFSRWNPATGRREALAIHWDDRALSLGAEFENPSPVEALDGLAEAQHGWGSFAASSPGNEAWVDTWASARTQTLAFTIEDSSMLDARALDASALEDASVLDASVTTEDASVLEDASMLDASVPLFDAAPSTVDAASLRADAGSVATFTPDAAVAPLGGLAGGALCSAKPNAQPNALLVLLPLALVVVLRRRS